jgi:hypothetical protein
MRRRILCGTPRRLASFERLNSAMPASGAVVVRGAHVADLQGCGDDGSEGGLTGSGVCDLSRPP